jgi:hypothetical protein
VSDVDVIAECAPGRRLSLLDMVAIENRLGDMLGVRVDLSPAKGLNEPVATKASGEAVLAFREPRFPGETSSTASTRSCSSCVVWISRRSGKTRKRLPRWSARASVPCLPWHNIRGIGNWLRHRYDKVDVETLWNTLVDDLPLRSAVSLALTPSPANPEGLAPG